mmetsp:Transcript_1222/g.1848  ORF Transcript_1222/g.1848 Transcript_1222/m.1848 type:complete len:332 (-) Transcript_1222:699-1694(-)
MSSGICVTGLSLSSEASAKGFRSSLPRISRVSNMPRTIFTMAAWSPGFCTSNPSAKNHRTTSASAPPRMARMVCAILYCSPGSMTLVCPQSSRPMRRPGMSSRLPGCGSPLKRPSLKIMYPQALARMLSMRAATTLPTRPETRGRRGSRDAARPSGVSPMRVCSSANRESGTPSRKLMISSCGLAKTDLGTAILRMRAFCMARQMRSMAPASRRKSNSLSSCFSSSRMGVTRSWLISYRCRKEKALRRLLRSETIISLACGYCTFTATFSPVRLRKPTCTCESEAAPTGALRSRLRNTEPRGAHSSRSTMAFTLAAGMGGTWSCSWLSSRR